MSVTLYSKDNEHCVLSDEDYLKMLHGDSVPMSFKYRNLGEDCECDGTFTADNFRFVGPASIDDPVNHPSHYTKGRYECIKVMEDVYGPEIVAHFCLCNAFKYMWRTNNKNGVQDMEKARWYSDKYVELMKKVEE